MVAKLIETLPGKTVITSDHGHLFGERPGLSYPFRVFGHPTRIHVKPLVQVPWLIIDNERVRTEHVQEEETMKYSHAQEEDEKIKDRLRKLGYL